MDGCERIGDQRSLALASPVPTSTLPGTPPCTGPRRGQCGSTCRGRGRWRDRRRAALHRRGAGGRAGAHPHRAASLFMPPACGQPPCRQRILNPMPICYALADLTRRRGAGRDGGGGGRAGCRRHRRRRPRRHRPQACRQECREGYAHAAGSHVGTGTRKHLMPSPFLGPSPAKQVFSAHRRHRSRPPAEHGGSERSVAGVCCCRRRHGESPRGTGGGGWVGRARLWVGKVGWAARAAEAVGRASEEAQVGWVRLGNMGGLGGGAGLGSHLRGSTGPAWRRRLGMVWSTCQPAPSPLGAAGRQALCVMLPVALSLTF